MNNYLAAIELFGFVAPDDADWDYIESIEEYFDVCLSELWEPDEEVVINPCNDWNELCMKYGMVHLLEPDEFMAYNEWGGCEDETPMALASHESKSL